MNLNKAFLQCVLPKKTLAWIQLGLLVYALGYSWVHQYNNPAVLVESCGLVDHHLHQYPDNHACDLCDFHTRLQWISTAIVFTTPDFYLEWTTQQVALPEIEVTYAIPSRAPPVS
jgi:hypothetical protein